MHSMSIIKRPARDACLCMGELLAPAAPPAPHFVNFSQINHSPTFGRAFTL